MKDAKSIILIIVITLLVGAAGYLVYLIQDSTDPLVFFNTRASEKDGASPNSKLLADAQFTPTPTISFTSTSPTPETSITPDQLSPTQSPSTAPTQSPSVEPTAPPAALPETGGGAIIVTATPTPIQELLQSGFSGWLGPMTLGGGVLILLALLL